MTRLEAATAAIGALAIVIALASVDWRLGLGALGVALILFSIEITIRRPA